MHLTKFLLAKEIDGETLLLINTLSGAVDLIEKKYAEILFNPRRERSIPRGVKRRLRERDYLLTMEEGKRALRHLGRLISIRQSALSDFFLCYTYFCNLRCIYCNESHLSDGIKEIKAMKPAQLDAALDVILGIKNSSRTTGKGVVTLFGGEPLLPVNRRSILTTLRFARENGFAVRIVSNGVLVERFKEILSSYRDVIEIIAISLDGPRPINDQRRRALRGSSFDKIVRGINILLSEGLPIEIRPIVDQGNVDSLPDLAKFIIKQGWITHQNFSAAIAKTMFPLEAARLDYAHTLSSPEFLKRLNTLTSQHPEMSIFGNQWLGDFEPFGYLREILDGQEIAMPRLSGCRAVNPGMYIFGPDNLIYPCLELVGIPQYATGTFYPCFREFEGREWWRKFRILEWSPKCRECNLVTLCGGGCPLKYFISQARNRDEIGCAEIRETLDTYIDINKNRFVNLA